MVVNKLLCFKATVTGFSKRTPVLSSSYIGKHPVGLELGSKMDLNSQRQILSSTDLRRMCIILKSSNAAVCICFVSIILFVSNSVLIKCII